MDTGKSKERGISPEDLETWQELEKVLHTVSEEQSPLRKSILKDIFKAGLKLAKESPGTLNLKIAATALKELRYSFKMFYPHRFTPKVTIFGSARVPSDAPNYKLAKAFAAQAVKEHYMILTGGGPGIMAAGNEGAEAKGGFGLNILLPMEQDPNPFIDTENNLIHYKYFFTRKLFLVKEASAFAFFPGGFGTFDEAFEVLTLVQTGKNPLIPIVLLENKGDQYWEKFTEFIKDCLLGGGYISATDLNLFHICHDPKEAMDHISAFYKNYHSMRFVKDELAIRIKKELPQKTVDQMTEEFQDIIVQGGKIRLQGPLPAERNEPEIADLPRLVFQFDRRDYSRLRSLIDFINENTV